MQETAVNKIVRLLLAQQQGEITASEQQELDAWINMSAANRQFAERCLDQPEVAASLEQLDKIDEEAGWRLFVEKNGLEYTPVVPFHRNPWRWIAAAVTIGVLATGLYLFFNQGSKKADTGVVATSKGENIQPGTNKATLTLSDGRTITLDDKQDGVLAREGGAEVNKEGNALVYDPNAAAKDNTGKKVSTGYHQVATPVGGTYSVILPDQSKVWLNAESSIRYPAVFTGRERRVEMTGEAYFEVAKDASKPFIVSTGDAQVRVLGTHFNIRNYADEETIKTTLLEGSVQVTATQDDKKVVLKPAQQASIPTQSNKSHSIPSLSRDIGIQTVEVESVVAWKNGYFDFRAAPFTDIMKEVRRWYSGIESVEIKTPVNDLFTASIPRNVTLSTMLTILEETGRVQFEVKDKTIIVTK